MYHTGMGGRVLSKWAVLLVGERELRPNTVTKKHLWAKDGANAINPFPKKVYEGPAANWLGLKFWAEKTPSRSS